jgi:hypothetical protein
VGDKISLCPKVDQRSQRVLNISASFKIDSNYFLPFCSEEKSPSSQKDGGPGDPRDYPISRLPNYSITKSDGDLGDPTPLSIPSAAGAYADGERGTPRMFAA